MGSEKYMVILDKENIYYDEDLPVEYLREMAHHKVATIKKDRIISLKKKARNFYDV
jgi:hypothetical protein